MRPAFGRGPSRASGPPSAVVIEERLARRLRDLLAVLGSDHEDVRGSVTSPERSSHLDAVANLIPPFRVVSLEQVIRRLVDNGNKGSGVLLRRRLEVEHRLAEGFADQKVGLGVVVVVMALASGGHGGIPPVVADFDGLHIALVFGMTSRFTVHRELGVGDGLAGPGEFPAVEGDGREHEGCLRRVELLPQRRDQSNEIRLVPTRVRRVLILVPLPPDETRDLPGMIVGGGGVVGEVVEDLPDVGHEVVVLLARIPVDRLAGIILGPGRRIVLVARVDSPAVLEAFASRGKDVPAQASVSLGGLDEKDRLVVTIADRDAEAQFGTDQVGAGPESGFQPAATISRGDLDAPDVVAHPPVTRVVDQVLSFALGLDEMFERAFRLHRTDSTEPDHVRLTHQDVDPDRWRRWIVVVRSVVLADGSVRRRKERQAHAAQESSTSQSRRGGGATSRDGRWGDSHDRLHDLVGRAGRGGMRVASATK